MENKKPLAETHPHLKSFFVFLDELNKESDRGRVLIAGTMLDDLMLQITQAFLIDGASAVKLTKGFNAPLGTFSARTEAAHALGLITENEYKDVITIKGIRNDFAHGITISFDDPSLIARCASLHHSAKLDPPQMVSARGQFTTAATGLILNLTNRPYYVAQKRLMPVGWPI